MSLLRSPKLRSIRSRFASFRNRLGGKASHSARQLKHRRLIVDPLEERTLLSVSAADYDDTLVNQTIDSVQQGTLAAQSLAVDHDGDFVVVWTRYDEVLEPDPANPGEMIPVIDPDTGEPMLDANIYARYFTDEVQRITLPDAIAVDTSGDDIAGSFSLLYGGNEVQKISITATWGPYYTNYSDIAGSVTFGFDVNGNGIVGPTETTTVFFDESSDDFTEIAAQFQTALQGLGGALTDVTVTGTNPHEYIVEFGDLSLGQDQPEITVESATFTSGFLPAVLTSTVREPVVIGPISVSATDPYQTANAIEQTFRLTNRDFLIGPVTFPPQDPSRIDWPEGPQDYPAVVRTAVPGVTVRPVWELDPTDNTLRPSRTKFDFTFDGATGAKEGNSGKKDHPEMVVSTAWDENGKSWQDNNDNGVKDPGEPFFADLSDVDTLKEPSDEFRVNPPEPDNPFTPLPDLYKQTRPDVAMDADGEFVITWQSEVPDVEEYGTVSDVFARRFAPAATVEPGEEEFYADMDRDGVAETAIRGVRALDNGFRVNTTTVGAQGQPAVGMGDDGTFVIAWGSGTDGFTHVLPGQDFSYFNGIRARRFNHDGTPAGEEWLVNSEVTSIHLEPYVALSLNNRFIIVWETTDDENFLNEPNDPYGRSIEWKLYGAGGAELIPQTSLGGGRAPAAAFDDNENFVITWDTGSDPDNVGITSEGVRAVMYELFDQEGNVSGAEIRSEFRANSSSFDPASNTLWPGWHGDSEPALDADGDLVIAYEGVGPDVSEDTNWTSSPDQHVEDAFREALTDLFYKPENADLLQFFDPATEEFPLSRYGSTSYYDSGGNYVRLGSTNEIDTDIENILIRAMTRTDPPATNEQLGRIRALLDEVVGLLRGEQWGVMYSSYDTDPNVGPLNLLYGDSIANAQRDGHNQRYILTIPRTSEGGDFVVGLSNRYTPGTEDVTIAPRYPNNVLDVSATRDAIETALEAATFTGDSWAPHSVPGQVLFEGPIAIRVVSSFEIRGKQGTPWDYDNAPVFWSPDLLTDLADDAVYEITFQGEVHDTPFSMWLVSSALDFADGVPEESPTVFAYQQGDTGTQQMEVSIGMEQDGDFVMAWTQREEFTWGGASNYNIYYRRFTESTDTAGPKPTGLVNRDNEEMANDDRIAGPAQYFVLRFDEELLCVDPADNPDSVLNPENFLLYRGDVEIPFGVAKVEFGMNKAAELAGTDDGLGGTYPSGWTASNKWEAVLILDANGPTSGVSSLGPGEYTIEARAPQPTEGVSGLRDKAGNPLGFSGFMPDGRDFSRTFYVERFGSDFSVTGGTAYGATTYAQTRSAVAVDADGDHVVVVTKAVSQPGGGTLDKVFVRLFNADGTPASALFPVTTHSSFDSDQQRYGTVDMDADGDFVVTWTNYRDGDADVYARHFAANGTPSGAAFRVHTYTDNNQKWSDVALDPDGDFVVTWSSYGQEDGGNLGSEYGVYARRFNRFAQPLGVEFPVNVTSGGNQRFSAIDMADNGNFVIVWTSDQNGVGDDIVARLFEADGKPKIGPLGGELVVNGGQPPGVTDGNQRYPDVAMTPSGDDFVVTWTSAGEDGSGDGVFGRAINVPLLEEQADPVMDYTWTGAEQFQFGTTVRSTIDVPFDIPINNFTVADLDVLVDIDHPTTYDVELTLVSPAGTSVLLVENEPDPFTPSSDFAGTVFDDEQPVAITDPAETGPYNNPDGYQPEGLATFGMGFGLDAFDGEKSSGTWTLICQDTVDRGASELPGTLNEWTLTLTRKPAMGAVFQVNTSVAGNQQFASIAMSRRGSFTVAWSGRGDQARQEDIEGSGVFFRNFAVDGTPLGEETRANLISAGNQRFASIDGDGAGDFVIAWTGDDPANLGTTDVYRTTSADFVSFRDLDGPVVSDVMLADGSPLLDGDAVEAALGVTELVVAFSEDLSTRDDDIGPDSVLNPDNWSLERNGSELPGVIDKVEFDWNPLSRKYEARVAFDASGIGDGAAALPEGNYVLTVLDTINDRYDYKADDLYFQGNDLDGDFDGSPGTSGAVSGQSGFTFRFSVVTGPQSGAETRINDAAATYLQQTFSEPLGTGYAREQSTRSVAVDHDGDFVAVWTSYGQDDPNDINGGGVYLRMYDRDDNPIVDPDTGLPMGEKLVNTTTGGYQRNASVAMDADGEFVVVWEAKNEYVDGSSGDNPDGSWGIYARRYSSIGEPLGGQFRVNTTTQNDQLNPSVAMDDFGNFLIVWATKGQPYGYFNDVRGQLYNYRGDRIGSEFLVNEVTIPGTATGPGSIELNPAAAMDDDGNFVVAWDQIIAQQNGVVTDSQIVARLFDNTGAAVTTEFAVGSGVGEPGDPDIGRTARNPQAIMDDRGGFIITWESYIDQPDTFYDVFFEQFDATGASVANGQVNALPPEQDEDNPLPDLVFDEDQVNPSVAIDADGEFAIVWNGKGARPYVLGADPPTVADLDLVTEKDNEGVFIRSYNAASQVVSVQSRVNRTQSGIQQFGSIGMERDGDLVVAWSGAGVGDRNGIFFRRYNESTDTAGPLVSDLQQLTGQRIEYGAQLIEPLSHLVVVFDEEMMTAGADSVTNPANYQLLRDGVVVPLAGVTIDFGLNMSRDVLIAEGLLTPSQAKPTNKWEAVFHFHDDASPGFEPLGDGHYQLVIRNSVRDVVGNPLGRTGWNFNGNDFMGEFDIVVMIDEEILVNDPDDDPTPGAEDQITRPMVDDADNSPRAAAGDADGEYVSVWTDTTPGQEGVYAKVYNDLRWFDISTGRVSSGPVPDAPILVTDNPTATFASVARDEDGDFVVTWTQDDGTGGTSDWNVWARRYDAAGNPFGKAFMVNSVTEGTQRCPAVAMDADGDFIVTWQSNDELGATLPGQTRDDSGYGIYAQRYSPAGQRVGGVDEVQMLTFIGNPTGTFSLYWDGDNDSGTSNVTGPIQFNGNTFEVVDEIEARLNALAGDANQVAVVAVSATEIAIQFVGPSSSRDQAQIVVDPAGTSLVGDPGARLQVSTRTEGATGEFLVNETTDNNQVHPSIAMSKTGDFVISWTSAGQDGDPNHQTNIYARLFPSNDVFGPERITSAGSKSTAEFVPSWAQQSRKIVTTDAIANHLVDVGTGYDGVVEIDVTSLSGAWMGTGSLLTSGFHILTAAHVVWEDLTNSPVANADVTFETVSGVLTLNSSQIFVHPDYDPVNLSNDIAIIVLPQQAPVDADRYQIYRGSNEIDHQIDIVGYGMTGQGDTGEAGAGGIRYQGLNVYETLGDPFNGMPARDFALGAGSIQTEPGTLLVYDFDNGLAVNDALGVLLGLDDLGLGQNEAIAASGDSGGPNFINGQIAGVVSFGLAPVDSDLDGGTFNVTFGELQFDTRVSAYAEWIDSVLAIQPAGTGEFLVNDTIANNQKWSSVAMDSDGDFVITWTSYGQDGVGNGYGAGYYGMEGVYAKRYNADGTEFNDPATGQPLGEFQVNTYADGKQQRSQVAMDADGDFTIIWESYQDRPVSPQGDDSPDSFGIFAQRYARNADVGTNPFLGPNGEMGGEMPINNTKPGDQRFPTIVLDNTGDVVMFWSGYGERPYADRDDAQGIFHQRSEKLKDDAGPTVADVVNIINQNGSFVLQQVLENSTLESGVTQFLVSFGEDLFDDNTYLLNSVTNPSNWVLTRDDTIVVDGVVSVEFGLNQSFNSVPQVIPGRTNKYEALITFDGDPDALGNQPLGGGLYQLTLRDRVEDLFDNTLDGDFDGTPGGDFDLTFRVLAGADDVPVPPGPPGPDDDDDLIPADEWHNQDDPAVASNDYGDYVVVWVEYDDNGDGDIMAQRFDRYGEKIGTEFIVNTYQIGDQGEPDVAMDAYGNFAVTWSGEGLVDERGTVDLSSIFARVFDAFGNPVDEQFMVNKFRQHVQDAPSVAMDANGDFAITWTSYGQDGDLDGVYARRYTFLGEPKDADDVLVNTTWLNRQDNSDIAMDADGNYVIVWAAYRHPSDNSEWGIFGQLYNAAGARLGGEFLINTFTADDQMDAHVAMDDDGDFIVTWASYLQDGSGWGVYARRFDPAGNARDGNAFRVNQTTAYWQYQPDVAMDNDGNFVVTWTTVGQDNEDADDEGIFARVFNADGTARYVDPNTGLSLGEFQVNATVLDDQFDSAVAMDADGDFPVVWVGPDDDGYGVYGRHFPVNAPSQGGLFGIGTGTNGGAFYYAGASGGTSTVLQLKGTSGNDVFEFIAGPTAGASIVRINGVQQVVASGTTSIRFDGLAGRDNVILTGSLNDETVELWPDHGVFTAARYTVQTSNVERIDAYAGGGTDVALLHDDPDRADLLELKPDYGRFTGDGFDNGVFDYRYVHAYATAGGGDVAKLYDDPHTPDTLDATPNIAKLYGDEFYSRVLNFDYVHAYATAGGGDVAKLYDDPNAPDTFDAWPQMVKMYGNGFYNRAKSFDYVHAYATAGGGDVAKLYDDPNAPDTFDAWPQIVKMYGNGFYNRAKSFDYVHAYATAGGGDVAKLYDDPNAPDTFEAWPDQARLYGDSFYNRVKSFDYVHAYATSGKADVAKLYDDPNGDDLFEAWPDQARLYGDSFYNRVKSFRYVYAYATQGGNDVAKLYDSEGKDTFVGEPNRSRLYGDGFFNQAKSFRNVYAYSKEGDYDNAYLYDSALADYPDHLEAEADWARLSNDLLDAACYAYWVRDFEEVTATASNASDTKDVDEGALDFILRTEGEW